MRPDVSPAHPIYRVRGDGSVDRLGEWIHSERRLVLERAGFPLHPIGDHRLESELPWVFWEMCPAGYLGAQFARRLPELRLPPDPRLWSAEDCLRAISTHGHELPGNLIVGDESLALFRRWTFDGREAWDQLQALLREEFRPGTESSIGGERPKMVAYRGDGSSYMLKFSPPLGTRLGDRWGDLLRTEAHCARTLREFRVDAVNATAHQMRDRVTLTLDRFDRLRNRGRRGATTLYWYAMDRLGDVSGQAPDVVAALVSDGHLDPVARETCARVHAFSAAILNTDTHLANYGLVVDDEGGVRLAPFYDISPMALAPRHNELPDAYLAPPSAPAVESIRPWLESLVERVEADVEISTGFKDLWRRQIGV